MTSNDLSFCLKCEYGQTKTSNCQNTFLICLKKIPAFNIRVPYARPSATVHNVIGKLQEDDSYKSVVCNLRENGLDWHDKPFEVPNECPFMLERLLK